MYGTAGTAPKKPGRRKRRGNLRGHRFSRISTVLKERAGIFC